MFLGTNWGVGQIPDPFGFAFDQVCVFVILVAVVASRLVGGCICILL